MFSSNKKKTDERFKVVYEQGNLATYKVLVDTETGVNYIFHGHGYAGGLTVLLDKDCKPIITPIEE